MSDLTRRRRRPARRWHRWLGFLIAAPLLFVSVTGVLLNHITELGWDRRHARSPWLMAHYGMGPEGEPVTYAAGNGRFVSASGGQLFLDGIALDSTGELVGAATLADGIAVVTRNAVNVHAVDGRLIDTLDEASLPPSALTNAGTTADKLLIVHTDDRRSWRFTSDLLHFEETETPPSVIWSLPADTPEALCRAMEEAYRGKGLPWSRVLLDLHSGRFWGAAGKWIADLVVVLIVVLTLTGLRLGFRAARNPTNGGTGNSNS